MQYRCGTYSLCNTGAVPILKPFKFLPVDQFSYLIKWWDPERVMDLDPDLANFFGSGQIRKKLLLTLMCSVSVQVPGAENTHGGWYRPCGTSTRDKVYHSCSGGPIWDNWLLYSKTKLCFFILYTCTYRVIWWW